MVIMQLCTGYMTQYDAALLIVQPHKPANQKLGDPELNKSAPLPPVSWSIPIRPNGPIILNTTQEAGMRYQFSRLLSSWVV